jgi:hypothetical protein
MKLRGNFGLKFGHTLWAVGLMLMLALSAWARDCADDMSGGRNQACVNPADPDSISSPAIPGPIEVSDRPEITQYLMGFDGDHSLDLATVVEQATGGYAHYTVRLHLASGVEQSIVVAAPPGGLHLEMHDMTGDKIPNDLILRPALLRWLPTVLVNDGHDHFAVAISGTNPDCFSCGQALDSQGSDGRGTVGLISSGFKTGRLVNDERLFLRQVQEGRVSLTTPTSAKSLSCSTSSGRAPPALVFTE